MPPTVTDEMVDGLTAQLGAAAVVELTAVTLGFRQFDDPRQQRARHRESQGFSKRLRIAVGDADHRCPWRGNG